MPLESKRAVVQRAFDALVTERAHLRHIRLSDIRMRVGADVCSSTVAKWTEQLCQERGLTYVGRTQVTPEVVLTIIHSRFVTGQSPARIASHTGLCVDTVYRKVREYKRWCDARHLETNDKYTIERYDNDIINRKPRRT